MTRLRPNIVNGAVATRQVVLGEFSVRWEENIEKVHESKRGRYCELEEECREKGWKVYCQPFEVRCGRYLGDFLCVSISTWSVWEGIKKEDV